MSSKDALDEAVVLHRVDARPDAKAVEAWRARFEQTQALLARAELEFEQAKLIRKFPPSDR